MALRKYQSVEKAKVVDPEEQARITASLKSLGKTSATQLTDIERRQILDS